MAKKLRYPCLVLDHDDTTVDSTASVHYPSFCYSMSYLRPTVKMSLEEYFKMNHNPGIMAYYHDEIKLTPEEFKKEHADWSRFASERTPKAYPGIKEMLIEYKNRGGKIAVVSTNLKDHILRDYQTNGLPEPDLVYGGDYPREKQKPHIFPILKVMEELHVSKEDILVIDDLAMGELMAENAGVAFVASWWSHRLEEVKEYMLQKGRLVFESPEEFAKYLLQ